MPDCVVNASPLITLGRVGRIGLLERLFGGVVVPQGVADEVSEGPVGDVARGWVESEGRRWVVPHIGVHMEDRPMKALRSAIVSAIMAAFVGIALQGCNTVKGAGKDIERGGKAIQRSSERVQEDHH